MRSAAAQRSSTSVARSPAVTSVGQPMAEPRAAGQPGHRLPVLIDAPDSVVIPIPRRVVIGPARRVISGHVLPNSTWNRWRY